VKAVVFDLDGTLLDTLDDLADSMNAALSVMGLPLHPTDTYRFMVGDGIETLARRVLPANRQDEESIRICVAGMGEAYEQRWHAKSSPYPGIAQLLDTLTATGIVMTVFSNKPHKFTVKVIDALLPQWRFALVIGAKAGVPKKPDPFGALEIAQHLRIPPREFLYVGDTDTDMRTAVAAGMYPVGALWGFRSAEELETAGAKTLISHPMDLMKLIV